MHLELNVLDDMVMSRVHLPGQIQLPVSPSLALEDVGDQGSLGVSVLFLADVNVCNLEGIDPQNREALRSGVRRTSHLHLPPPPPPVTGKLSAV